MRFVPRSVMTGFVNALAILIFLAQLPHLTDGGVAVYALVAVGLAVMYLLPRVTDGGPGAAGRDRPADRRLPVAGIDVPTVGDEGSLPDSLPVPRDPGGAASRCRRWRSSPPTR